MKFNFKKIAPILASAILLGSTIGFASVTADLGSYPAPFVSGGEAAVTIIYGADGMAIDMEAAALLTGDLATELASQTAEAGEAVTKLVGESVRLDTAVTKIYYGDALNKAKSSPLSKGDLPTLLADGKIVDKSGITYTYTQQITLPTTTIAFTSSGESIDPVMHAAIGTTASNGMYNYTLSLNKALNVSHSDVYGESTVKILGREFLIGPDSDSDTLILYAAGITTKVIEDEVQTIELGGKDYEIVLEGTASDIAYLKFDETSKTCDAGTAYNFPGDIVIYVKTVYHAGAGKIGWANLVVGTKKLTIEGDSTTEITELKGGVETAIRKTIATMTGSGGEVTKIVIGQAAEKAKGDHIDVGSYLEDRVFGGVKLEFASLTPALDSEARDVVKLTGKPLGAEITFTPALSGEEFTLNYAHDRDSTADATVHAILADDTNHTIHVLEGEAFGEDEYVIVNAGDNGMILRVDTIDGGAAGKTTKFTDILTKEVYVFDTGEDYDAPLSIGGEEYFVNVTDVTGTPQAKLTWGAASAAGNVGTYTTLFPRIKLKNGEYLTFLTQTQVNTSLDYILPGEEIFSTYNTGINLNAVVSGPNDYVRNYTTVGTDGGVHYVYDAPDNETSELVNIFGISTAADTDVECYFNDTDDIGPAVLIQEEHQLGETDGTFVCIPLTNTGKTVDGPAINTPVFSDDTAATFAQLLVSDVSKYQAVDEYGTFVEYDKKTDSNYYATIWYPDEQMIADLFIAEIAAEAAVTEVTAAGVVPLGDVILTDDEAAIIKPLTHLIVVGDAAVNKVAFELVKEEAATAGLTYPVYGEGLTTLYGYGADQAIIKQFVSPYSADWIAILVAGWEGPDTVAAAKQLIDKTETLVDLDDQVKIITKGVDYK